IAGLRQGFADQLVGDAGRRVHDLEGLAAGRQIDAVLTDAMFVAGRLWHERGGPVWASLGDGPLTYADVDTPPYGAGLLPMRGREGRRRNRVTTRILRELIWGPALERLGAIRCELGLVQSGRSVLEEAMSPHLHLQACVPEFEYPRQDLPAQVRFVGALRPEPTDRKLPPWWAEFLADDRPAVLVSQGTLRPDLTELVLPTIAALTGAGLQVVVTTGAGSMADLRAGLGRSVPEWLRVARWIPYEDVLPHVDAFVTNGGYTGGDPGPGPRRAAGAGRQQRGEGGDRGPDRLVEGRGAAALASDPVAAAADGAAGPERPRHQNCGRRDAGVLRPPRCGR
ncbi:MAG TPA: hypothetical protein VNA11_16445, partial [Pseudonocardia sp.]|nr:hypothetical protein [Pseudonocardia sp.]